MSVLAHGVDIVEVSRIGAMVAEHGEHFLERVFTQGEREYAHASKRRDEHLAGRFAAKEAVLKALGTGWSQGIAWTDIEVTRGPAGEPGVRLSGKAKSIADSLGIGRWVLSLSHTENYAVASAIGLQMLA